MISIYILYGMEIDCVATRYCLCSCSPIFLNYATSLFVQSEKSHLRFSCAVRFRVKYYPMVDRPPDLTIDRGVIFHSLSYSCNCGATIVVPKFFYSRCIDCSIFGNALIAKIKSRHLGFNSFCGILQAYERTSGYSNYHSGQVYHQKLYFARIDISISL